MKLSNDELFEKHKGIVYYCYNELSKNEFIIQSEDDIIQEGFVGLWRAICKINVDNVDETTIPPYLFAAVKRAMIRWLDNNYYKHVKNNISLEATLSQDTTDGELTLSDVLSVNDTYCFEEIDSVIDDLLICYKKYLKKEKQVKECINLRLHRAKLILYEMYYSEKFTARMMEHKYDINRTTVGIILKELQEALKYKYNKRG